MLKMKITLFELVKRVKWVIDPNISPVFILIHISNTPHSCQHHDLAISISRAIFFYLYCRRKSIPGPRTESPYIGLRPGEVSASKCKLGIYRA